MISFGSCGSGSLSHEGSISQISLAYSAIVRSLENFPEAEMLYIALRVHSCGFCLAKGQSGKWANAKATLTLYNLDTSSWHLI